MNHADILDALQRDVAEASATEKPPGMDAFQFGDAIDAAKRRIAALDGPALLEALLGALPYMKQRRIPPNEKEMPAAFAQQLVDMESAIADAGKALGP